MAVIFLSMLLNYFLWAVSIVNYKALNILNPLSVKRTPVSSWTNCLKCEGFLTVKGLMHVGSFLGGKNPSKSSYLPSHYFLCKYQKQSYCPGISKCAEIRTEKCVVKLGRECLVCLLEMAVMATEFLSRPEAHSVSLLFSNRRSSY